MDEHAFAGLSPSRRRAHVTAAVDAIIRAHGKTADAKDLERLADALAIRLNSYDRNSLMGRSIVSELRRRAAAHRPRRIPV